MKRRHGKIRIDIDRYLTLRQEDRDRVVNWLRDHGIDPEVTYRFRLSRRRVYGHCYRLNDAGRRYLDSAGVIATERVSVPLRRRLTIAGLP